MEKKSRIEQNRPMGKIPATSLSQQAAAAAIDGPEERFFLPSHSGNNSVDLKRLFSFSLGYSVSLNVSSWGLQKLRLSRRSSDCRCKYSQSSG